MNLWNNIENKISYHAVYDKSIIEALKFAKNNNFSGIQLAVESPHLSFEHLSHEKRKEIKDFCKNNGYFTVKNKLVKYGQRQQQYLQQYCEKKQITNYIHITDTAFGLNTKHSGLKKLFKLIKSGKVARIIITFKDRLTRFGFEYIMLYCSIFNVSIIILKNLLEKSVQQELVDDMMSLTTCFSGKLYGLRSRQSRIKNKLKN